MLERTSMSDRFRTARIVREIAAALAVAIAASAGAVSASAASGPPATAAEAPDTLGLAAYRGKVVVVDFWASWCKPCHQSLPWLAEMQRNHGDQGLVVLTVNLDRERERADRFVADSKFSLPVIYDPEGELARIFDLQGMPSSFVYDRAGRLRATHLGFHPEEAAGLESELLALLAEENRNGG
jgi:YD repeat-containing protein